MAGCVGTMEKLLPTAGLPLASSPLSPPQDTSLTVPLKPASAAADLLPSTVLREQGGLNLHLAPNPRLALEQEQSPPACSRVQRRKEQSSSWTLEPTEPEGRETQCGQ